VLIGVFDVSRFFFSLEVLLDRCPEDCVQGLVADFGDAIDSVSEGVVEIEAADWFCHCGLFRFFEIPVAWCLSTLVVS
jgi:hypothetical protein